MNHGSDDDDDPAALNKELAERSKDYRGKTLSKGDIAAIKKLYKDEMIDRTPVQLFGKNIKITQSVEDLVLIHRGAVIEFVPK